jgi:hypothetical protein
MNETLQKWLAERLTAPGTLGGGISLADGTCLCHSVDEQFPAEKIERVLQQLAQSQPPLADTSLAPRWSTWLFEQGKVRCVVRPDGLLLGLAVRVDTDAARALNTLSDDFLALTVPA